MSVRPYRLISCSFYRILSISHTGNHYNVAGVMEETFFRVIFGPFSAIFKAKYGLLTNVRPYHLISCSFYRILSISHAGHRYNIVSVIKNFLCSGHFSGRFHPFLGYKRPRNQNSSKTVKKI